MLTSSYLQTNLSPTPQMNIADSSGTGIWQDWNGVQRTERIHIKNCVLLV